MSIHIMSIEQAIQAVEDKGIDTDLEQRQNICLG